MSVKALNTVAQSVTKERKIEMKKVKIFFNYQGDTLEQEVNDFVATHNVIDIQFQLSGGATRSFAVLIVYEE